MAVEYGVQVTKNVYIDNLNQYIKDLNDELEEINRSLAKHKSFFNGLENRKAEISMEIERVRSKISEISKSTDLSEIGMDGALSSINSEALTETRGKENDAKEELNELKEQYKNAESVTEKMIILSAKFPP